MPENDVISSEQGGQREVTPSITTRANPLRNKLLSIRDIPQRALQIAALTTAFMSMPIDIAHASGENTDLGVPVTPANCSIGNGDRDLLIGLKKFINYTAINCWNLAEVYDPNGDSHMNLQLQVNGQWEFYTLFYRSKINLVEGTDGGTTTVGLNGVYKQRSNNGPLFPEEQGLLDSTSTTQSPQTTNNSETQMTPEQAINDIQIKYPDVSRQNFIRGLLTDGISVFDQTYTASDSDSEGDTYFKKLTGKTPGEIWEQAGNLNDMLADIDFIGPPDPRETRGCGKPDQDACWQLVHDRKNKSGSIGIKETFYTAIIPNSSPAFERAYQVFSPFKEVRAIRYLKDGYSGDAAELLSAFDISVQLNKYINNNKNILGLTRAEMVKLRTVYRTYAFSLALS